MTVVGFTGTQRGMTDEQQDALRYVLEQIRFDSIDHRADTPDEFHHGDCIGADAEARTIAKAREYHLHCHPGFPEGHPKRAGTRNDETYPLLNPLARNKRIVDEADVIVAAPASATETRRSGTWMTVRYAQRNNKPVVFVLPTGVVTGDTIWLPSRVTA